MRNRAKCRKCQKIIESFHDSDYVLCECEEISVSGGAAMYCAAKDFKNFIRIDDKDKEVEVVIQERITKTKLEELQEIINLGKEMPQEVLMAPASYSDLLGFMSLVSECLKADS